MPVYHHYNGIPSQHFVLHTGTMTIVRERDIFKGAWIRDGKSDESIAPLSQEQKDNLLFDQLQNFYADPHPEWFYVVFKTKDGRGECIQFRYFCRSPYYTTAPMC